MFGITIHNADENLGMCGSIEFSINPGMPRFHVYHTMSDGMQLAKYDSVNNRYGERNRVKEEDIIALLPDKFGWNWSTFYAAWTGFAEGYKRGEFAEIDRRRNSPA